MGRLAAWICARTQVAKRVGFSGATWHDPAHVGYYQPVFTAICPEVRLKEHS
jgi:hypothetical protein